ncbi:hypothetical protein F4777DRAFT_563932 [Nemania sp. FL0916]|nr:hypothetical protein F4777DRAFT_563932 [Nemania sp. FL0916]
MSQLYSKRRRFVALVRLQQRQPPLTVCSSSSLGCDVCTFRSLGAYKYSDTHDVLNACFRLSSIQSTDQLSEIYITIIEYTAFYISEALKSYSSTMPANSTHVIYGGEIQVKETHRFSSIEPDDSHEIEEYNISNFVNGPPCIPTPLMLSPCEVKTRHVDRIMAQLGNISSRLP